MESKNKFHLQKITSRDYDAAVALVNSAYRGDSSRAGWTTEAEYLDGQRTDAVTLTTDLKDQNKTLLCARADVSEEIIGTVLLEKTADDAGDFFYLGMLTVKPTLQVAGLGKWMMNEVEKFVTAAGVNRIRLSVLNPRHELMAWYERRGFKPTGQLQPFPYGDEKFGRPQTEGLHFVMFEKVLG